MKEKTNKFTLQVFPFLLITLLFMSCCGQQEVVESPEDNIKTNQGPPIIEDLFATGVITKTNETKTCNWVIKLEDGRIFETDKIKDNFLKDGLVVSFQYRNTRRSPNCDGAIPVDIMEMTMSM